MADKPVSAADQRRLFQTDHAFFGRITASMSHEMNNVLSIINEYAGLLGDLVAMSEQKGNLDPARVIKISGNIGNQITRGKEITRRINRFAHSVDDPVQTVEVQAQLRAILDLAGHYVRSKNMTLDAKLSDETNLFTGDPFKLQHAVFVALSLFAESGEPEDEILVTCESVAGGTEIVVSARVAAESSDASSQRLFLQKIMAEIDGAATFDKSGGRARCILALQIM